MIQQASSYDLALAAAVDAAAKLDGAFHRAITSGALDELDVALDVLAELDELAQTIAAARDQVATHVVKHPAWRGKTLELPGLLAEKVRRRYRRWDVPRTVGRIAHLTLIDRETGEKDVAVSERQAELVLRRALEFISSPAFKITSLRRSGVEVDDLYVDEDKGVTVKVTRVKGQP